MRRPRSRRNAFAEARDRREFVAHVLDLDRIARYVGSLGPARLRRLNAMFNR